MRLERSLLFPKPLASRTGLGAPGAMMWVLVLAVSCLVCALPAKIYHRKSELKARVTWWLLLSSLRSKKSSVGHRVKDAVYSWLPSLWKASLSSWGSPCESSEKLSVTGDCFLV